MTMNRQLEDNAPWKRRFRAPVIVWTQIAPANPARGLVINNASGKHQLYAWDVPSGALRQLTERPAGIRFGLLSGDGRYVYYLDDQQGNEIGHFVRIPFEGGEAQDLTPGLPPYSALDFAASGSGSHFGFVAADADGFHIYSLETRAPGELGAPRELFHSPKIALGPLYSYGGEVAVVATTDRATVQHYNLLGFDTTSGAPIAELWDGPGISLEPVGGFAPQRGDLRLAGITNRSGVKRPFVWNPRSGERVDLDGSDLEGEIFPVDWSGDARRLLLCQFTQAVQHLYLYDLTTRTLTQLNHPSGTLDCLAGPYFGPEGEIFAQWQDAVHPSQLIALDARTGEKTRIVLTAGDVPPGHAWTSMTFPSSDGQRIQGWLGLPEGTGPFPTILHAHGGPEGVMTEMYRPDSQMWLDHGFAFLTINYRGSTTFSREFQEKIWGDLGHWEVEDYLVAARHWLVQEGIARPDAIFLTGWSYGGYLTLMGLGKWPDLWAGGMAGTAVSDWAMMYEDSADAIKGYQVALFGGTPQEKPEHYRLSSPITYAEHVKAPVLVIQGRNDTRTPARPIEVYAQTLKALGKAIEVHWYDAGHMGAGVEQDIQHFEIMLRFACRVLG